MGLKFINGSLDIKIDAMKYKLQKNISRKIQSSLSDENGENFLINLAFQHFKAKELIHNSLVSRKWYNTIGKLKTFRDRVAITCKNGGLELLERSERYYKKIDINVDNDLWHIQDAEKVILKYSPHLKKLRLVKIGG
jgi:CRISPR/Cas system CMR-associated protein Cmr1 (group 7 of RAMP superfamily)